MSPAGSRFLGFTIASFRWSRGSGSFGPNFHTRNEPGWRRPVLRDYPAKQGYTFLEQVWARPTAEVNGFGSGYQGEGPKTIVPSKATAKLSFRLVPDQDPVRIESLAFENFLKQSVP